MHVERQLLDRTDTLDPTVGGRLYQTFRGIRDVVGGTKLRRYLLGAIVDFWWWMEYTTGGADIDCQTLWDMAGFLSLSHNGDHLCNDESVSDLLLHNIEEGFYPVGRIGGGLTLGLTATPGEQMVHLRVYLAYAPKFYANENPNCRIYDHEACLSMFLDQGIFESRVPAIVYPAGWQPPTIADPNMHISVQLQVHETPDEIPYQPTKLKHVDASSSPIILNGPVRKYDSMYVRDLANGLNHLFALGAGFDPTVIPEMTVDGIKMIEKLNLYEYVESLAAIHPTGDAIGNFGIAALDPVRGIIIPVRIPNDADHFTQIPGGASWEINNLIGVKSGQVRVFGREIRNPTTDEIATQYELMGLQPPAPVDTHIGGRSSTQYNMTREVGIGVPKRKGSPRLNRGAGK